MTHLLKQKEKARSRERHGFLRATTAAPRHHWWRLPQATLPGFSARTRTSLDLQTSLVHQAVTVTTIYTPDALDAQQGTVEKCIEQNSQNFPQQIDHHTTLRLELISRNRDHHGLTESPAEHRGEDRDDDAYNHCGHNFDLQTRSLVHRAETVPALIARSYPRRDNLSFASFSVPHLGQGHS
jgi:hypothetical protein